MVQGGTFMVLEKPIGFLLQTPVNEFFEQFYTMDISFGKVQFGTG